MLTLILLLIVAACAVGLHRWRRGVVGAIVIALIQDPLRKMVPGAPGYLAMSSLPVWICALASAMLAGDLRVREFFNSLPRLGQWLSAFGGYLLIPAALSLTYGKNAWMITLLGTVIYSIAFIALLVGWRHPQQKHAVTRFLGSYVVLVSVALIGGPLDYFGLMPDVAAIGTEALDTEWMTARTGEIVYMYAGFFRSPDVMGWHASVAAMIAGLLAYKSKGLMRILWISVALWAISNIWICGRRKMIAMLPVFWGTFLLVYIRFKDVRQVFAIAGIILLFVGLGGSIIGKTYHVTSFDSFYLTTINQFDDAMINHGFRAVVTTVQQAGFWGYGLGMGQQGIHHIPAETPHLWQESGPSRMMAELGVPGFLLMLGVLFTLLRTAWHIMFVSRNDDSFTMVAGLFALLVANIISSVVSGQIFGDPFIILFLSFLTGMLLSLPRTIRSPEEQQCLS